MIRSSFLKLLAAILLMTAQEIWAGDGIKEQRKASQPMPGSIVKINVGPVWTASKVYVSSPSYYSGDYDVYEDVTGIGGMLSWAHLGEKGLGMGFDFYANHTSFASNAYYTLLSLGPNLTGAFGMGKSAMFVGAVGGGLAHSNSNDNSNDTNLGFYWRLSVGVDIRLSETFGVGVEGFMQKSYLNKPKGVRLPENESYGFGHVGVLFGVRFYR